MITFSTALYSEAKDIIIKLGLKKLSNEHIIQIFEGEDCRLLLTGCGMIASASAVSRYYTLFPTNAEDIFVNLGLAGYASSDSFAGLPVGTCCQVNKIVEQSTGRTFYPDILFQNNFSKLPVLTSPTIVTQTTCSQENTLIDMEASALYQAVLPHVSPERMFFFKIISDIIGENAAINDRHTNPVHPEALCRMHTEAVLSFAQSVQAKLQEENNRTLLLGKQLPAENKIRELLPMTDAMELEFERLLTYAKLSLLPLENVMEKFLTEFPEVPIRGKKQAMPYLNRFRELILDAVPESEYSKQGNDEQTTSCADRQNIPASYVPFFSQGYIENDLYDQHKKLFVENSPVKIDHYKDIFNRSHQNFARQKKAPALIFAKKTGTLIYQGAPVCQSFGNEYFYYTSCMMNCIYHCDYCYLQGMYPSGHVVVFVNLEDYFAELETLLKQHPVYLCISYDTDLLALENRFGFVSQWLTFAGTHPDLTLEIRTKSGNTAVFESLSSLYSGFKEKLKQNIIFAWTLSPQKIIESTEHGAASLSLRIKAAKAAKAAGFRIRLCFDPMIYHGGWKESYQCLITDVFAQLSPTDLFDVSIGVFRISTEYLKNMRKKRPDSAIVQYPYSTENGVSHYGSLSEEMVHYLYDLLTEHLPGEKIFIWNGGI